MEREPAHKPSASRGSKGKTILRRAIRVLVIALTTTVLCLFAVYLCLVWASYDLRHSIEPGQLFTMTQFLNRTTTVPDKCLHPAPFDPQLVSKALILCQKRVKEIATINTSSTLESLPKSLSDFPSEKLKTECLTKLLISNELLAEQWTSVSAILQTETDSLRLARELANDPKYELDVFFSPDLENHNMPSGVHASIEQSLLLKAYLEAHEGRTAESLETANVVLIFVRTRKDWDLLPQVVKAQNVRNVAILLSNVTRENVPVDQWRRILLKTADSNFHPQLVYMLEPSTDAIVTMMRLLQTDSHRVQVSEHPTGRQLIDAFFDFCHRDDPTISNPNRVPFRFESRVRQFALFLLSGRWGERYVSDAIKIAIMKDVAVPNEYEVRVRDQVAMTWLRMARLCIADKLSAQTGQTTASILTPSIPLERMDPFTTGPLLRNPGGQGWHSVGPDHVDNKAEILYDPTNGTYSGGDIVALRPQ